MHQNTVTKHSRQHCSSDGLVKTTPNLSLAKCPGGESSSRTVTDNKPTDSSDATTSLAKYHGASLETDLTNTEITATDTHLSGTEAIDYVYTPISQDELVQQICDAADMACKAKRINQLMSYVSGIDYSQAQNSACESAIGDPGADNNEHLLATERK